MVLGHRERRNEHFTEYHTIEYGGEIKAGIVGFTAEFKTRAAGIGTIKDDASIMTTILKDVLHVPGTKDVGS